MMRILILLVLGCAAIVPAQEILVLTDGSRVEGTRHSLGDRLELRSLFGRCEVPRDAVVSTCGLQEARGLYEDAAEGLPPEHIEARQALARFCLGRGYYTGLRRELDLMLEAQPNHPWVHDLLAEFARRWQPISREGRPLAGRRLAAYLLDDLAERDPFGAALAMHQGQDLDEAAVVHEAVAALRKGKPWARWAAARLLAPHRHTPERINPLYRAALADPVPVVRTEAVRSLKVTEDPVFVKLFAKNLSNPVARVRVNAAQALGEFGHGSAIRPLVQALADSWSPTRNHILVANQVAYVKDFDVEVAQNAVIADPIVDVVTDGAVLDVAVISISIERRTFAAALSRLTGINLGHDAQAWRAYLSDRGL
jgi:hypothetical protein